MGRRPHGFTLLEMAIVVGLMAVLGATMAFAWRSVSYRVVSQQAKLTLADVVSAQQVWFSTRGFYADDQAEWSELGLDGDLVLLAGGTPSGGPGEVSVAQGVVDGWATLGVAVYAGNGECYTWRAAEPDAPQKDVRLRFEIGGADQCSGIRALTDTRGTPW